MNALDLAVLGLLAVAVVVVLAKRSTPRATTEASPVTPPPQSPFREPAPLFPEPPPRNEPLVETPAPPSPGSILVTTLAVFAYVVVAAVGALAVFLSVVMVNFPTCFIPPDGQASCPPDSSAGFTGALVPLVVLWLLVGGVGYAVVSMASKAMRTRSLSLAAGAFALAVLGLVGGLGALFFIALVLAGR